MATRYELKLHRDVDGFQVIDFIHPVTGETEYNGRVEQTIIEAVHNQIHEGTVKLVRY